MISLRAGVLVATAFATALLFLRISTQASFPDRPPGAQGWSGDFLYYYLPNAEYAGARLAKGELPLWNPRQGAGGPFLATLQTGVLYPPNWLHALLPAPTAFVALAVAHVALGVLLAGALAGALGAGPLGCAVAGMLYATSNQLAGAVWSPPIFYAATWVPGVLLAVERILERATARRAAALAGAVAMQALAGWPLTFAMTALAAVLYAGVLLGLRTGRTRRAPLRPAFALGLGAATGLLLAAPQLLPAAELVARSCRALGSLVEAQAVFVTRPHEPSVVLGSLWQRGFNDSVPGAVSLVLSALALGLPGPGRARAGALLLVGVVGLLASFPNHLPLYGWLRELPVFGDFRFPFRYRLLPCFALAIAAGVGTGHLERALARRPRAAFAGGCLALAAALVSAAIPMLRFPIPFARSVAPARTLEDELAQLGVSASALGSGRIYWADRADKLRAIGEHAAVHDLEPLTLARTAQLLTFLETGRPLTVLTLERDPVPRRGKGDSVAAPFYGFLVLPKDGRRASILDLFSARLLVTAEPVAWLHPHYRRLTARDAALAVFENPSALPRAYRVAGARPESPELRESLRRLASAAFDPRNVVMLDDPPASLLGRTPAVRDEAAEVRIALYEPERVVLKTRGDEPGVVVLTDAHFPGWEATLDGEPVPLLRANLNFRAVEVPPGAHRIEMRYRPASFRWGLALALGAGSACLAAVLFDGTGRPRATAGPRQTMREVRFPQ